jgi:hypothetical protein
MNTSNHPIHRKAACRGRGAIYALATNPDEVRCVTEDQLDAWWRSQSPEDKAEIYEQRLEPAEESCRYCGCTRAHIIVTLDIAAEVFRWVEGVPQPLAQPTLELPSPPALHISEGGRQQ